MGYEAERGVSDKIKALSLLNRMQWSVCGLDLEGKIRSALDITGFDTLIKNTL